MCDTFTTVAASMAQVSKKKETYSDPDIDLLSEPFGAMESFVKRGDKKTSLLKATSLALCSQYLGEYICYASVNIKGLKSRDRQNIYGIYLSIQIVVDLARYK